MIHNSHPKGIIHLNRSEHVREVIIHGGLRRTYIRANRFMISIRARHIEIRHIETRDINIRCIDIQAELAKVRSSSTYIGTRTEKVSMSGLHWSSSHNDGCISGETRSLQLSRFRNQEN